MSIKLGNLNISSFKVGGNDCSIYLGTVKLYPESEPSYSGFCKLTLNDDSVVEIEGSGELTDAMIIDYSETTVAAEIGDKCTSIGQSAFQNCSGLTSVTIGNSVTSIGSYTFSNCSSLQSVTIGNSVTSIGSSTFSYCTSLSSVTIPNSVTSIGDGAFEGCSSLSLVSIGSGVTSIGDLAFFDCSGLTEINVEGLVPATLGFMVFDNDAPIYVDCSVVDDYKSAWSDFADRIQCKGTPSYSGFCKLTLNDDSVVELEGEGELSRHVTSGYSATCVSAEIGNKCTSIGELAFFKHQALTSVTIPTSVTSIGNQAFHNCSGLTSVTIPNSVTSIGNNAFMDCSGLTEVAIGSGVTSIESEAFYGCESLLSITCLPETPPTLGTSAFDNTNEAPIYVSSVDTYKTAERWSTAYADRLQPIS